MKLRRRDNGEEFALFDGAVVGRLDSCDWVVSDASISRRHAKVIQIGEDWQVEDLDSSNGIRIRGERVRSGDLRSGDILTLGSVACDVIGKTMAPALPQDRSLSSKLDPEAAAHRRREQLRREAKKSSGLGDLGQLPGGMQALILLLSATFVWGVIWLVRTLGANI